MTTKKISSIDNNKIQILKTVKFPVSLFFYLEKTVISLGN